MKHWKRTLLVALSICCLTGAFVQAAEPEDTLQKLEPTFTLREKTPVHFTGPNQTDYVLSGYFKQSGYGPSHMATIMAYDAATQKWQPVYTSEKQYASLRVLKGDLLHNQKEQIVLHKHEGSGGFLSYDVLGWLNEKPQVLLSCSGIFQGGVEIKDGNLVEHMGHQDTVYSWKGKRMKAKALPEEMAVPADYTISFVIGTNGAVYTSQEYLTMKVGETMQLRRRNRGLTERVLYNGNGPLSAKDDLFTANQTGTTTITIIPNGYDWKKAVKITIQVVR